ncbi:hypothetical protein [Xanthomonas medicagonis]|uniref:hypothetical protein n=1 Tax=Xanthomonas medicagonis TaxID=3160841 RepID=UPI0035162A4A
MAAVAAPADDDTAIDPLHPGLVRTGVVMAFLIGGPPLGTFVVALPMLLFGALDGGESPVGALVGALGISLFSYLFGAVPALLTGLVAAWSWPRLRGWRAHLRMGAIGFVLSLLCFAIAFPLMGSRSTDSFTDDAPTLLLFSLPGLIAGVLVSRLLQALRGS